MSDADQQSTTRLAPAIRRAPLDKLTIFEVTEAELETLERGSPVSVFLNLAISALSTAIALSVTLGTTPVDSRKTFDVFVIVTVVGYVAGGTFLLLWLFTRKSIKAVAQVIRKRLPPEGVPALTSTKNDGTET
jgi:hypothetical protein